MHRQKRFYLYLIFFLAAFFFYGFYKACLGMDFTDEGAYLAWPLRLLFGEKLFSSEIVTLVRPMELLLIWPLRLHPSMTLFEWRMLGWTGHLTAFFLLSLWLFRAGNPPLQSLLIAAIPCYGDNALAIGTPSYNTISSDSLLIFFVLWTLPGRSGARSGVGLQIVAGFCLFIATVVYPSLIILGPAVLAVGLISYRFDKDAAGATVSPLTSLACPIVFFAGWLLLAIGLYFSGSADLWAKRLPLILASTPLNAAQSHPLQFYRELFAYLVSFSPLSPPYAGLAVATTAGVIVFQRKGSIASGERVSVLFGIVSVAGLLVFYPKEPYYLTSFLTLAGLATSIVYLSISTRLDWSQNSRLQCAVSLGIVATMIYASSTHYFTPWRSWVSGAFGLPFCFSVSLSRLLSPAGERSFFRRFGSAAVLTAAVIVLACANFNNVYRDGCPGRLSAEFSGVPKLAHIKSAPMRVASIERLYVYLKPKLVYGEPLLVYDDCPLLYFILDAKPAYGLAWAVRFNVPPATLLALNREFTSRPLPRFAVRAMIDVSYDDWDGAPAENFQNYPLNDSVMAHYKLDKTIFPFEIWRLKPKQ
jgi:hypothetical protein